VRRRSGQRVVTNFGNHRHHWQSGVSWNIGIGLPFYGRYYGGYPYYGSYYGGYPYYSGSYYGVRVLSIRLYRQLLCSNYPYYSNRTVYRGYNRSVVVARVQERLARAGYYGGRIDGVMGPRTPMRLELTSADMVCQVME
jgi:hypothetical protein